MITYQQLQGATLQDLQSNPDLQRLFGVLYFGVDHAGDISRLLPMYASGARNFSSDLGYVVGQISKGPTDVVDKLEQYGAANNPSNPTDYQNALGLRTQGLSALQDWVSRWNGYGLDASTLPTVQNLYKGFGSTPGGGTTSQQAAAADEAARQADIQRATQIGQQNGTLQPGQTAASGFTVPGTGAPSGGAAGSAGALGIDVSNLPPEFQALFTQLNDYLKKLQANGQSINPNVTIDPTKVAEFMAQAQREIDPYYANQLKVAKDQFLTGLGFSQDQIANQEKQIEQQYGRQLKGIGESSAEQGFAQSGIRKVDEQQLAQDTQNTIDTNRRNLSFNANQAAGSFAGQFGTANLPTLSGISNPTVTAGEMNFSRPGASSSLYSLSPSVYNGLTGTQEYQHTADVTNRASQLEEAYRQQLATNQQRTLTI